MPMTMAAPSSPSPPIPAWYRIIYLYLEPVSTFVGAVYAHHFPSLYLQLQHADSAPRGPPPLGTSIVLTQLANLYLLLCINEALVLRATTDLKVWKTFLFGLLVADLGHLYSVHPVGTWVYWRFWDWNAIDWGNVPFVYFLALSRVLFLCDVGFDASRVHGKKKA